MVKKHILDCEESLWRRIVIFKLEKNLKDNNEAVVTLLERGLLKVR